MWSMVAPSIEALKKAEVVISATVGLCDCKFATVDTLDGGMVVFVLGGQRESSGTWEHHTDVIIGPNGRVTDIWATESVPEALYMRWNFIQHSDMFLEFAKVMAELDSTMKEILSSRKDRPQEPHLR